MKLKKKKQKKKKKTLVDNRADGGVVEKGVGKTMINLNRK